MGKSGLTSLAALSSSSSQLTGLHALEQPTAFSALTNTILSMPFLLPQSGMPFRFVAAWITSAYPLRLSSGCTCSFRQLFFNSQAAWHVLLSIH